MSQDYGALEPVARSICLAAVYRKWPKAQVDFLTRRVEACWEEYVPDARLVMETVNRLVQVEAIEDSAADLPQLPAWLVTQ